MSRIVFDSFSIAEIVPPQHDQETFYYRYQNGAGAERLPDFQELRKALSPLLKEGPRTADELAKAVTAKPSTLIRVLDYLFAHSGEVATLEVPGKDSYYIWADAQVAEQVRTQFALGSVHFESETISREDLPILTSYLTNLLVLRPSVETLDKTIDKTQRLLDAYRMKRAIQGGQEDDARIALLREKLDQLRRRREIELERWSHDASTHPEPSAVESGSGAEPASGPGAGSSDTGARELYPFPTLYLLGSNYNYTGPEKEKRLSWRDPAIRRLEFPRLRKIVVEMDTFFDDVAHGVSVHDKVEEIRKALFPEHKLEIVYRRVSGISYSRKVEKRLHEETVRLIERGYKVLR